MSRTPDICPETELLMQIAWRDCLLWSIGSKDPNFVSVYEEATGNKMPTPPRNGLEAMIDEATGHQEEGLLKYIEWFNIYVWGETFGPATKEAL